MSARSRKARRGCCPALTFLRKERHGRCPSARRFVATLTASTRNRPPPVTSSSLVLGFLDRIAADSRNGDLDEGVLLGRVTGRAGCPQRLDTLPEERGVLLLDGLSHLDKGTLEEELLGTLAVDRP